MGTAKTLFGTVFGRLLFRTCRVRAVTDPATRFRAITFEGEDLRDVSPNASEKVQIFLPGIGMRTYTPIDWNTALGRATILGYVHVDGGGASPGARWVRDLRAGDTCRFFGPRPSIPFASMPGPVVFFGDETSFATIRAATTLRRSEDDLHSFCEIDDTTACETVLRSTLELTRPRLFARKAAGAHRIELAEAMAKVLAARPEARLVLTGSAQSIQFVRAFLRERGLLREGKIKPYWSAGKTGLD